MGFIRISDVNGLCINNPLNARQNNYAWSISELGDYIYVGTGRNIIATLLKVYFNDINLPISIDPLDMDNRAEIWRYRKDGSEKWQKVFKAPEDSNVYGFRYMINYKAYGANEALYAAGATISTVKIYKSTNGVDWIETKSEVYPEGNLKGTSSRTMLVHNDRLYLANIDESGTSLSDDNLRYKTEGTLLYSNKDPEFYPWELEIFDPTTPNYDPSKNPQGGITNMAVFNNRIYIATSSDNGVQVWRTDSDEPEFNGWTLVVDNGFENPNNKITLSMGVFKNHLYVSGTKKLPISWAIPMGCDVIRIDKHDKWEMVVGKNGKSGMYSGFNNPFNVYAWQIQEYNDKLYITTFDDAINMQLILELLLANRDNLPVSPHVTEILIEIYEAITKILNKIGYPFGFSLYSSSDGIHFDPVFLDGFNNRYNYGGRILFVDSQNDLYIGTANPFEGLEVWKGKYDCEYDIEDETFDYDEIYETIRCYINDLEDYKDSINEAIQFVFTQLPKY